MCTEREQLIGYLYDECDAAGRAAMQRHLEACAECRAELAGLRGVQADLQSWEVPDHESVWKPFAPAPAAVWWSQVPRWAMAAAAGAVLVSGAIGGAATAALLPRFQPTVAAAAPAGVATTSDLAALERRIEARMQAEVEALNSRVSIFDARTDPLDVEATLHRTFDRQLAELRAMSAQQLDVINAINNNLGQLRLGFNAQYGLLKTRMDHLAQVVDLNR